MKTQTFLICILCTTLVYSQTPFLHIESQNLKKKNTEYFGSSEDVTVNTKKEKPTLINFNPAITLDEENEYLKINETIPESRQLTVFTVFMPAETSDEKFNIWRIQTENSSLTMTNIFADNSASQLGYGGIENGKPNINTYTQYYRTGADEYTDGESYVVWGGTSHQDHASFNGAIAEMISYNKILTANYRQKVISSLAIKYGISLKNQQNYTASDDQIIWNGVNDSIYSNSITGIARDDELKLYQKQSTSANQPGFLTISVDSIQATNEENAGIIQDQYFMLWGDNGAALKQQKSESINGISVLDRKWLMNVTGSEADDVVTQLKIDASSMLNDDISSYFLVIDESGTGNFEVQYTRFVYPTNVSEDGIISYDNVKWDQDGSGKDVFSFKIDDRPENFIDEAIIDTDGYVDLFAVYPSLTTDGNYKIYVQLEQVENINIKVFDMAGKLVSDSKLRNQNVYHLDGVPIKTAGLYNVALYTKYGKFSKKIVVEN